MESDNVRLIDDDLESNNHAARLSKPIGKPRLPKFPSVRPYPGYVANQRHDFSIAPPPVPTVFVLQTYEEPAAANAHCCLAWLSCLLCPCALPTGVTALLCSACATCDSDKQSRRCKSSCALGCAVATLTIGFATLLAVTLFYFSYPPFNEALTKAYYSIFEPCSDWMLEQYLRSIIESVGEINPNAVSNKLSKLEYCGETRIRTYVENNWSQILELFANKFIG